MVKSTTTTQHFTSETTIAYLPTKQKMQCEYVCIVTKTKTQIKKSQDLNVKISNPAIKQLVAKNSV